jgi:hypothetical protein
VSAREYKGKSAKYSIKYEGSQKPYTMPRFGYLGIRSRGITNPLGSQGY